MPSPPAAASRLHYAWIVAGVTFLILLITAGVWATSADGLLCVLAGLSFLTVGRRALPTPAARPALA